MARIDKYDPVDGGFRAPLAADRTGSATPVGVGLDVNGRVVDGAGQTGVVGILCKPDDAKAGQVVDVMTHGELVEFAGVAGTTYYINGATGALETSAPAAGTNKVKAGFTVEATRLVVRVESHQG